MPSLPNIIALVANISSYYWPVCFNLLALLLTGWRPLDSRWPGLGQHTPGEAFAGGIRPGARSICKCFRPYTTSWTARPRLCRLPGSARLRRAGRRHRVRPGAQDRPQLVRKRTDPP